MHPRLCASLVLVLGACGADDSPATSADAAQPDAASPDGTLPDAALPDGAAPDGAAPDAVVLPPGPNRVFVTAGTALGDFGGLAFADAMCASEASAAGLTGTFVAWLSTSTVDARDRLGASRGWVRVDGVPVIDTVDGWLAGLTMFNPIDRDATGTPRRSPIWTGTGPDGRVVAGGTCQDWTHVLPLTALGSPAAAMPDFTDGVDGECFSNGRFACFEVGRAAVVTPAPDPTATRIAFVSRARRSAPGVAHLDGICRGEAADAGLPGTYRAAVATSTASIASRFTVDARSWRRPDGTRVAGPELLVDVEYLDSFVNQHADGTYASRPTMSGASRPTELGANTCNDWTTLTTGLYDQGAPFSTRARALWAAVGFVGCGSPQSVLCLQE